MFVLRRWRSMYFASSRRYAFWWRHEFGVDVGDLSSASRETVEGLSRGSF